MLDAVILERKHTATTITVAIPTPHATSGPLKPEHGNLKNKGNMENNVTHSLDEMKLRNPPNMMFSLLKQGVCRSAF